ncbi:hypothetical protein NSS64_30575 [Paenibacillus sp. FSL H8-0122]|uniref:hypothetical protein n=1 Tax=Paenibacillus sp. FSL H8-0122 TaxID=2954510 RepID=UPI0030F9D3D1
MSTDEIYRAVRNTVSLYINKDFNDETNLLGITSVRNIIYILIDLENNLNLKINDSTIKEIKELTIHNLIKLLPVYLK